MQELQKILKEIELEKKRCSLSRDCSNEYAVTEISLLEKIEKIIRKHMNDGWIPVEERLPEQEAMKYIDEELNGIGYLYPCLLTYRSPMTERIHVVRFYYDVYEHWFVNAGENVCEKDRCIAWRPLPDLYQPEIES